MATELGGVLPVILLCVGGSATLASIAMLQYFRKEALGFGTLSVGVFLVSAAFIVFTGEILGCPLN